MNSEAYIIQIITEIPKGSSNKYEYNSQSKRISLDRVLYGSNFYPANYGFIENTLDEDGDPLDVVILSTYPILPNCEVKMKVLGGIDMFDNDEQDTKIFGVTANDPRFDHINTLQDVAEAQKKELINFFQQYKALENKKVIIHG
jgi:inorganic pyrophosphatase